MQPHIQSPTAIVNIPVDSLVQPLFVHSFTFDFYLLLPASSATTSSSSSSSFVFFSAPILLLVSVSNLDGESLGNHNLLLRLIERKNESK